MFSIELYDIDRLGRVPVAHSMAFKTQKEAEAFAQKLADGAEEDDRRGRQGYIWFHMQDGYRVVVGEWYAKGEDK